MSRIICAFVLFFTVMNCFSQNIPKNIEEHIYQSIEGFPENTQLSFCFINKGESQFFGLLKKDSLWQSVDNRDSIFEIGSISKVFTSVLFAKAVSEGDVGLDTPLDEVLGYPLKNDKTITLMQLSNHTSGLGRMPMNLGEAFAKDPFNPYKYYNKEHLKEWLTKSMRDSLNQETVEYSNLGAGVLGHAMATLYKKPYEELVQEKIFEPLEMKNSSTIIDEVEDKLIHGRTGNGEVTPHWEFDVLGGAGAIFSSTQDLEKFAQLFFSGKDEAIELTKVPTVMDTENLEIGLAWHIIHSKNGEKYYWHNGGTGGFTSSMLLNPTTKSGIIVLSNVSAISNPNTGNIDGISFDWASKEPEK